MTELLHFVDPTIPGLGGADILRLAGLPRGRNEAAERLLRERREAGRESDKG